MLMLVYFSFSIFSLCLLCMQVQIHFCTKTCFIFFDKLVFDYAVGFRLYAVGRSDSSGVTWAFSWYNEAKHKSNRVRLISLIVVRLLAVVLWTVKTVWCFGILCQGKLWLSIISRREIFTNNSVGLCQRITITRMRLNYYSMSYLLYCRLGYVD